MTPRFPSPCVARPAGPRPRPPAPRAAGQGSIEYLVVLTLLGISLTAGAGSPMARLLGAIADHHERLTDAVSRP